MSRFVAEALDARGELERRPWPIDEPLRFLAAAGSEAVQVRILEGERPIRLLEVEAPGEEPVELRLDDRGRASVEARRSLLRLPAETPARRPRRPGTGAGLDIALVIDATRLHLPTPDEDAPSLAVPMLSAAPWAAERQRFGHLVEELTGGGGKGSRFSVLSFGDRESPFPVAEDLRPSFLLEPVADRGFERFSRPRLEQRLAALRPSPGGDAVDAVAEALIAATDLPWRSGVRRLVLLLGDSPGYSISRPPPIGAASRARRLSLEEAAERLFTRDIDLVTFFLPPATERVAADSWRELLGYAERQYRRLASLPEWALTVDDVERFELPRAVLDPPEWLGFGPTVGFFA